MRGRKPTPNALKLIRGSRRVNPDEPQPIGEIPPCPDHLDDEARRQWDQLVPELLACGLLTCIDGSALAAYCQTWSRWVNAENELSKLGQIVKSPSGYPIVNPYLAICNRCIDQMHRYGCEFGMTPSSRTRIKVTPKQHENELTKFLQRV